MPELPEIETVKNGILQLKNQHIKKVTIWQPKLRYTVSKDLTTLNNQLIVKQISRRAKYIIIELSNESGIIIHLGMSGRLSFVTENTPKAKHDHVEFVFDNHVIRYNDPRRFGCIIYTTTNPYDHKIINSLGIEPLTDLFNAEYLIDSLKNRKCSIKQSIMNNDIVVGVGNIYACEALYKAKILPTRQSNTITQAEANLITKCIKEILTEAIQKGGSTLRDYQQASGELGYFQNHHQVYGRNNQPCNKCNSKIVAKRLGQRNSFFCPTCQK